MLKTEARMVTREIVHVIGANCDHCEKELVCKYGPAVIHLGPNNEFFGDVLAITLRGQYDGYFHGPDRSIMLCHECADKLVAAFPCIKSVIEDPQDGQID